MKYTLGLVLALTLLLGSCGRTQRVVVGSKRSLEQNIVGEIVAQHLENRWQGEVQRRINFGDTAIMHQAMLSGDITLYPEYTGTVLAETLRETPSQDASVAFERARAELKRTVQFAAFDPLGYDNRQLMVIRAADGDKINTVADAAARKDGWKIGVSTEFEHSAHGIPLLTSYGFPQGAPVRSMSEDVLFPGLMDGSLSLIVVSSADGHLTSSEWKVLQDDKNVFPPQQAMLLVRQDALDADPTLKPVLQELSGKISLGTIQKLAAKIVADEKISPADVARQFLQESGLHK